MDQIALYYPYGTPSTSWLKQALLASERVSSIFGPGMNPESDDLQSLADEGIWRPTLVRAPYAGGYRQEIEDALLEFADHDRFRVGATGATPALTDLATIQIGKLAYEIQHALSDLDLMYRQPDVDGMFMHREVAAIILAITAKYVAANHRDHDSRMMPSTDLAIAERFAYDPLRGRADRFRRWELLLEGLIPVAGETVSIPDVIAFREQHRDELLEFRVAIDRMLETIGTSEDPFDEVRAQRQSIEAALARIKRAARARRFRLTTVPLSILGTAVALGAAVEPATLHWVFDGIGTAAASAALDSRLVRGRRADDPLAYLVHARNRFM